MGKHVYAARGTIEYGDGRQLEFEYPDGEGMTFCHRSNFVKRSIAELVGLPPARSGWAPICLLEFLTGVVDKRGAVTGRLRVTFEDGSTRQAPYENLHGAHFVVRDAERGVQRQQYIPIAGPSPSGPRLEVRRIVLRAIPDPSTGAA